MEDVVAWVSVTSVVYGREGRKELGRENSPFGETFTVPSPLSGAVATQKTFCSLR